MARSLASLNRRSVIKPPICIIYGTKGIGKTTLAAGAPDPVLIAIEDGIGLLEVPHWDNVASFNDVVEALGALYTEEHDRKTLIVDSLDWLEPLVWGETCARNGWSSIETPGYNKGYLAAVEVWREYLDGIRALREDRRMTILQIAHDTIKRFDSPESDPYDRYLIKLNDRASALLQEHADIVGFMTYRISTKDKDVGFNKKVTRAVGGGNRVFYTEERPAWLAANRLGLPPAIDLPTQPKAWEQPETIWAAFAKHLPGCASGGASVGASGGAPVGASEGASVTTANGTTATTNGTSTGKE